MKNLFKTLEKGSINLDQELKVLEFRLILAALDEEKWVKAYACKRLGLNRTTLVERMRRHGIPLSYYIIDGETVKSTKVAQQAAL